eukprot:1177476-Alexandrium_andersonii.AAC.1
MSASLVGSEMCIRDRPAPLHRGPSEPSRGRLPSGAALWTKMLLHCNFGRREACLLYTSPSPRD